MHRAFEVTILGTGSAAPTKYRNPSGQLVRMEGEYFLIDCGEGTQHQIVRLGLRMHKIKYVLISHLHGDHFYGLPGLLTTMSLFGRTEKLIIVGPEPLKNVLETIFAASEGRITYEIEYVFTNFDKPTCVFKHNFWELHTIPLQHRIACTGFILKEAGPERKINIEVCEKLRVPISWYEELKAGGDWVLEDGTAVQNSLLTLPGKKNRSYAYISDSIYDENLLPHLQSLDLLYHEATFLDELIARARETFHTTARQAGQMAARAGVQKLLIGHFSSRYHDAEPLLAEAKAEFDNTEIAVEGQTYAV
jgi:ribonuclease Z